MPGGRYSAKEDRQAEHVADSERRAGKSAKEARSIGYAVVNKRKGKRRSRRKSRHR
jgi:hypothetical protein